ncbi:hypothetical protein [Metapseudomonas boanensis]|uniref:Uncharacterized protein n=1 Tax=Metapseudomonas boanensis TaxID=2822138 RepID=A0ABS5XHA0_9GAMM|nr:hypothetical protein [Pseudomonas boanensis]MBT8767067.1 hypothetical protein [Pseudomonas boanensis]
MTKLLGFAGVAQALSTTTLKRDALALKENLRSDVLPVKNEQCSFLPWWVSAAPQPTFHRN